MSPRYIIEPQRNIIHLHHGDPDDTWYAACDESDAEIWAVFDMADPNNPEWIDDFSSRAAAEQFIAN